jgi:beta-lactamase superfamily II metal-dependent hydrolase
MSGILKLYGKHIGVTILALLTALAFSVPALAGCAKAETAEPAETAKTPTTAQKIGDSLRITWFNVGPGDSILIRTPHNKVVLVDGGLPKYGSGIVRKMKKMGISKVDCMISTHLHDDHVGGLPAVLKAFPVSKFYYSQGPSYKKSKLSKKLMKAVKAEKCKKVVAKRGKTIKLDGVTLKFVQTKKKYTSVKTNDDGNKGSLAVYITYGKRSALLTGDNMYETLSKIERHNVELMDIPHHGAGKKKVTPVKFYKWFDPEYAVISADGHTWGHPGVETFRNLKAYDPNILVFRTDKLGDITATATASGWTFDKVGQKPAKYC